MKNEEEIIRLMQERLQEAEAPVDTSIWEAIQQQLPAPPTPGPTGGASSISGWSAATKWAIGLVSVVIPAAAVVYFTVIDDGDAASRLLSGAADDKVSQTQEVNTPESDMSTSGVSSPKENPESSAVTKPQTETQPEDDSTPAMTTEPSREQVQAIYSDPAADTITIERVEEQAGSPLVRGVEESPSSEANIDTGELGTEGVTGRQAAEVNETIPEPEITVDVEDREALLYRFSAAAPEDAGYSYSWLINGEFVANGSETYYQFDTEAIYALQLRALRDGETEIELNRELEVYLPARLDLPNVFTPNGDGVNDRLTLGNGSRKVEIEQMIVYDSQGREVFIQYGDGPGWNGMDISGNELPEGNYILVLQAVSERGQPFNERQVVRLER